MSESPVLDADVYKSRYAKQGRFSSFYKEKSPDQFPLEEYKVSDKLTIQAVPLEFYRGDVLEKHGKNITDAIKKSDGVIFEYFPQELAKSSENPLARAVTDVDAFMPYFTHAATAASQAKKEVYALDPAHSLDFAMVRLTPMMVFGVGGALLTSAGLVAPFAESKGVAPKVARMLAGTQLGVGLGLMGVGAYENRAMKREHKRKTPSQSFTEPNFRRVVIAQGIKNIAAGLDADPASAPKKLLLLYPPIHWQGIKSYLDNPKKLQRNFRVASAFRLGGLKDKWFQIRNYIADGDKWNLTSSKRITASKSV
jgi:hypothetical protein